jgi:hypothetical protein
LHFFDIAVFLAGLSLNLTLRTSRYPATATGER